jgi:hypothetical protein
LWRPSGAGFVCWPGAAARRVEGADRGLAARQGASFVAVERPELFAAGLKDAREPRQISGRSAVAIIRGRGRFAVEQPVAPAPDAAEIDLRLGDPQRQRLQHRVRAVTGDARRECACLGSGLRIGKDRPVQAVAQRIARHLGLTGCGARSLAGAAVPAARHGALRAAQDAAPASAAGAVEAAGASIT